MWPRNSHATTSDMRKIIKMPDRKLPPKVRLTCRKLSFVPALTMLFAFIILHNSPPQQPVTTRTATATHAIHNLHSPESQPPSCVHVIAPNTPLHEWKVYNARSFCVTDRICISPRTISQATTIFHDHPMPPASSSASSSSSGATCRVTGPSLTTKLANKMNCSALHRSVFCAQGQYSFGTDDIACPGVQPFADAKVAAKVAANETTWIKGVAIVVPAYPYIGNIYHFAQAIIPAMQIIGNLQSLVKPFPEQVTLIIRGRSPKELGDWQQSVTSAIINQRIQKGGLQVKVHSFFEDEPFIQEAGHMKAEHMRDPPNTVCMNASILLGERYFGSMWPFASHDYAMQIPADLSKQVSHTEGHAVPFESTALRSSVYQDTKQESVLQSTSTTSTTLLDLPPLTLTYARRYSNVGTIPNSATFNGTFRRFSEEDDKWFMDMLKRQTQGHGFTLQVVEQDANTPFAQQVSAFRRSGVVIGIHGANLMNAMFAPAFGALIELTAVDHQCYIGGSNSGLQYWHVRPSKESGMGDADFDQTRNYKPVLMDDEGDRIVLTNVVRDALTSVRKLHRLFGHLEGVPVVYEDARAVHHIDWTRKRRWYARAVLSMWHAVVYSI